MSKSTMKKLIIFCACLALTGFSACQKQQTDEERKAEIDREVQQRLADERQAQEKEALAQRQADLDAREKALADKQAETAQTETSRTRSASARRETGDDESGYNIFYTKLESYGDWRETSDYGYVWQPREAQSSRNWHPYTEGRWVYTDAGWTWVSDEPFGWATYHYGRWARLRNIGWVWVPDNEWAPAWVSWRKSDDYVGWAPLPPEARFDRRRGIHTWSDNYYDVGPDQYRFVATREFGTRQSERTFVPRDRNVAIISQTTNVTNITYNNSMVVNQGPNYEELRSRTQQPIQRLRLERDEHFDRNADPRAVVRGEVVAIPAPAISIGVSIQRPRRVKEAVAQTTIEHGWDNVGDRQAAEQARTKMKSESTPPSDAPPKTFVKPAMAASSPASAAATATATATASASATATPTASVASSMTPSPTPRQPFVPKPATTPSPSSTLAPARPQKGMTPPPAASAAAPTASPTATASARKFTPPPAATASPSASVTASSEKPSPVPRRSLPPNTILLAPGTSGTPDDRPKVGERFKSQAKKFAPPPGDMPMSPSPSVTPATKPGGTSSPAAPAARTPFPTATPASTATPTPTPTPTPTASASASIASAPAGAPAASAPAAASKHEDKKGHKHEGGKPGEAVTPTPTPTP